MKKILFSLTMISLLLMVSISLSAKEITEQEAQTVAYQFLSKQKYKSQKKLAPNKSLTLKYTKFNSKNNTPLYYIFSQAEEGFVIVAGNDQIEPIIGYSDNGKFDINNLPDNFKAYLECCNKKIELDINNNKKIEQAEEDETETENTFAPYIAPLLGDICFI